MCRTLCFGFYGSECVLCVGQFVVGLWKRVCSVCGTGWCGFVGANVYCVWEGLVLFVGETVCCVWDSWVWVCVSVCVLCVGEFGVGLAE